MTDKKLVITVGLPGSGKSVAARIVASKLNAVIVDMDSIVTMLHGGKYGDYDSSLGDVYKSIETAAVCAALCAGRNVVIDRCNETRKSRSFWKGLAQRHNTACYYVCGRFHKESHGFLLQNRMLDPRGLPQERWDYVIKQRAASYEPVSIVEGIPRYLIDFDEEQ